MQRSTAWQHKASPTDKQLIDAIQNQRAGAFFLLQRTAPLRFLLKHESTTHNQSADTQSTHPTPVATVKTSKYKVTLGNPHTCTCQPHSSSPPHLCIHILFVLLKVLRVDAKSPFLFQTSLLDAELSQVLESHTKQQQENERRIAAKQRRALLKPTLDYDSTKQSFSSHSLKRRRLCADDCCVICQETMCEDDASAPLVYCEDSCGNAVHVKCCLVWSEHQLKLQGKITCSHCRHEWGANEVVDKLRKMSSKANLERQKKKREEEISKLRAEMKERQKEMKNAKPSRLAAEDKISFNSSAFGLQVQKLNLSNFVNAFDVNDASHTAPSLASNLRRSRIQARKLYHASSQSQSIHPFNNKSMEDDEKQNDDLSRLVLGGRSLYKMGDNAQDSIQQVSSSRRNMNETLAFIRKPKFTRMMFDAHLTKPSLQSKLSLHSHAVHSPIVDTIQSLQQNSIDIIERHAAPSSSQLHFETRILLPIQPHSAQSLAAFTESGTEVHQRQQSLSANSIEQYHPVEMENTATLNLIRTGACRSIARATRKPTIHATQSTTNSESIQSSSIAAPLPVHQQNHVLSTPAFSTVDAHQIRYPTQHKQSTLLFNKHTIRPPSATYPIKASTYARFYKMTNPAVKSQRPPNSTAVNVGKLIVEPWGRAILQVNWSSVEQS